MPPRRPILIDKFLDEAIEIDVDALCDGTDFVIGGIMEHIEEAGIHSGDSACSIPPYSISSAVVDEIRRQTRLMALELNVKGLMNVVGDPLPRVIHCVQDVAYPPVSLGKWPEQSPFEDRHGRLVFIVHDLTGDEIEAIRYALVAVQSAAGSRPSVAACPFPTRCWLAHNTTRGGSSVFDLAGWDVQPIRLRSHRAVPAL